VIAILRLKCLPFVRLIQVCRSLSLKEEGKSIFRFFHNFTFFQEDLKSETNSKIKLQNVFFCILSGLLRKKPFGSPK
jgi:hypothetical protein